MTPLTTASTPERALRPVARLEHPLLLHSITVPLAPGHDYGRDEPELVCGANCNGMS